MIEDPCALNCTRTRSYWPSASENRVGRARATSIKSDKVAAPIRIELDMFRTPLASMPPIVAETWVRIYGLCVAVVVQFRAKSCKGGLG